MEDTRSSFDTDDNIKHSPSMLDFAVDFYSDEERKKLESFDCFPAITDLVTQGFKFCEEEFLVYTIFREQKNRPGFRTYNDLKNKLPSRIEAFQDYFDLSSGSVVSKFAERHDKDNVRTEEAGVGAALALTSHLYGLTEADWERLPVSEEKGMDFQIASTGEKFIQVEAKGTVVNDKNKTQNIYAHKADIVAKKDAQPDDENNTNTLLGVITAFPSTNTLPTKCWILDPPAYEIDFDPLKYKLLSRLHYYWRELSMVSRSHFLEILINRIHAIRSTKAYKNLDNLPLLNRKGEPHPVPVSLFTKRSSDLGEEVFGEVLPLENSRGKFCFYGFHVEIVDIILSQNFNSIISMNFAPSIRKDAIVTARIPYRLLSDTGHDIDVDEDKESRKKIIMRGNLTLTSSGRVLGILQPIE